MTMQIDCDELYPRRLFTIEDRRMRPGSTEGSSVRSISACASPIIVRDEVFNSKSCCATFFNLYTKSARLLVEPVPKSKLFSFSRDFPRSPEISTRN